MTFLQLKVSILKRVNSILTKMSLQENIIGTLSSQSPQTGQFNSYPLSGAQQLPDT